MKVITILLIIIAITMALSSLTLITKNTENKEEKLPLKRMDTPENKKPMRSKNVSRFLVQQEKNPREANNCTSHHETCFLANNSTCCNNKCVDTKTDHQNCGKCKKICEVTETCCGGKCVKLAYDKKNCGRCDNMCDGGLLCIFGLCDYP
ncbi:hypothetical protein ACSBR2_011192 [Camellia fascicularis]